MPPTTVMLRAAGVLLFLCAPLGAAAHDTVTGLHFAPNGNFASNASYRPGKMGFNLADVSSVNQLDALPAGTRGLAWVGRCGGVDEAFLRIVRPYIGHPNVLGFYLMDDPDPVGKYSAHCAAENLKAEADWIHANLPRVQTFIVLMNIGSSRAPSFTDAYKPANSHVDLFGLSPYPCRTELTRCDFDMIDRYVAAAKASGIPPTSMVPVYQAFGGGDWADDEGGRYVLPTTGEEREILARWGALVPTAVFDFAYSWGAQRGDTALDSALDLQRVFLQHNNAH